MLTLQLNWAACSFSFCLSWLELCLLWMPDAFVLSGGGPVPPPRPTRSGADVQSNAANPPADGANNGGEPWLPASPAFAAAATASCWLLIGGASCQRLRTYSYVYAHVTSKPFCRPALQFTVRAYLFALAFIAPLAPSHFHSALSFTLFSPLLFTFSSLRTSSRNFPLADCGARLMCFFSSIALFDVAENFLQSAFPSTPRIAFQRATFRCLVTRSPSSRIVLTSTAYTPLLAFYSLRFRVCATLALFL